MRFGVLLPHFGKFASRNSILNIARRAEQLGFDSLWVRDHLIWKPHGIDGTDRTFVEPFVTLAAAGAVTERIELGTAVTIPLRWPLKLAQDFAALDFLAPGRIAAGIGLGANPAEFAAAGFRAEDREAIFVESVDIMRQAWTGSVDYGGERFTIEGVEIWPKPSAPIPILYGGSTPAGTRRAIRYTDGWFCGRLPLTTLDKRLELIAGMPEAEGRHIRKVIQPLVMIDHDREAARARVPVAAIAESSEGSKFWVKPTSGAFSTAEDLEGLLLWGTAEDIATQAMAFASRGIDDLVFDLRLQFEEFDSALDRIGHDVLPRIRQ